MTCLEDELPAGRRRGPRELAKFSFTEYVETRPRRRRRADKHVVLIFDGLDDILAASGSAEDTCEFFAAIGRALENETYWALLAVRDEHLVKLTRHQRSFPTKLSNLFRLGPLSAAGARHTVVELAKGGGRSFSKVDALIHDLAGAEAEDGGESSPCTCRSCAGACGTRRLEMN